MPRIAVVSTLDAGDLYMLDGDPDWVLIDHVYTSRSGDLIIVNEGDDGLWESSFDESACVLVPDDQDTGWPIP